MPVRCVPIVSAFKFDPNEIPEIVELARSAFVTRPVAVRLPVIVNDAAERPLGNVVDIDGTPDPDVTSTPLFAVARPDIVDPVVA